MNTQTEAPQVDGMAVDYEPLPERLRDTMRRWIEKGIPPGSGTTLILCHDLAAVCACDDETVAELPAIYRWMYNNAPSGCHGSRAIVALWGEWRRNAVRRNAVLQNHS